VTHKVNEINNYLLLLAASAVLARRWASYNLHIVL